MNVKSDLRWWWWWGGGDGGSSTPKLIEGDGGENEKPP